MYCFQDFVRKNEDELRENLSCFSNYSGPASLDLTKDISVNTHRSLDQSNTVKENGFRQNQTVTEISMNTSKNGKNSSNSSSSSSGNLVNPSTGPPSLLSFESGTSMSNDSVSQVISVNKMGFLRKRIMFRFSCLGDIITCSYHFRTNQL